MCFNPDLPRGFSPCSPPNGLSGLLSRGCLQRASTPSNRQFSNSTSQRIRDRTFFFSFLEFLPSDHFQGFEAEDFSIKVRTIFVSHPLPKGKKKKRISRGLRDTITPFRRDEEINFYSPSRAATCRFSPRRRVTGLSWPSAPVTSRTTRRRVTGLACFPLNARRWERRKSH